MAGAGIREQNLTKFQFSQHTGHPGRCICVQHVTLYTIPLERWQEHNFRQCVPYKPIHTEIQEKFPFHLCSSFSRRQSKSGDSCSLIGSVADWIRSDRDLFGRIKNFWSDPYPVMK
jgi:hypothetical protein